MDEEANSVKLKWLIRGTMGEFFTSRCFQKQTGNGTNLQLEEEKATKAEERGRGRERALPRPKTKQELVPYLLPLLSKSHRIPIFNPFIDKVKRRDIIMGKLKCGRSIKVCLLGVSLFVQPARRDSFDVQPELSQLLNEVKDCEAPKKPANRRRYA